MQSTPPITQPIQSPALIQIEQRRPHLYVGNLSPKVTDAVLMEIFSTAGPVLSVKIIPDRNHGQSYGFVELPDIRSAEMAIQTFNGRKVFENEIKVNWAHQGYISPQQQQVKEDTAHHAHVFVGDLSPEVTDELLAKAFSSFGSLSDARVMWDQNSGKSRGFGFVAFRDRKDAEQAITTMNGEWLGSRTIRCNWATQKTGTSGSNTPVGFSSGGGLTYQPPLSYENVVTQTPAYNSTVYVGNLVPYTTQTDIIPLFQSFGYIVEIRMQSDRGFAFIKLDSHENAALAIVQCNGFMLHGRPLKCSWGKDRVPFGMHDMHAAAAAAGGYYGLPAGNYGYGYGYQGQQDGSGGGGTTGSQGPGFSQGVTVGAPTSAVPGGWDPNQSNHGGDIFRGVQSGGGPQGHPHAHPGMNENATGTTGWPYEYTNAATGYYGYGGQQGGPPRTQGGAPMMAPPPTHQQLMPSLHHENSFSSMQNIAGNGTSVPVSQSSQHSTSPGAQAT